jgi:hypothetical protein
MDGLIFGLASRPATHSLRRAADGFFALCYAVRANHHNVAKTAHSPWKKLKAALERPESKLERVRAVALRAVSCGACACIQTTTRQRLDLILRIVEDPLGRKAYHAAAGLCLRHCIEAADAAEAPQALAELISAQIARLRVLEWELNEASRKASWSVRYEPKGPETDAWRRAAQQFSGE